LRQFSIKQDLYLKIGERIEWIKPIMFSGGIGTIDDRYVSKKSPQIGMSVAKIGGPVYRLGTR
jgi:phosphoribosylformylglycinamidine synthase